MSAAAGFLQAARPLVAMTFDEARESERHGRRLMYCQCDVLNPCWDERRGWGEYGPGKHWGGGDACPECTLRASIAEQQSMRTRLEDLMRRCREERHQPTYADLQGLLGEVQ